MVELGVAVAIGVVAATLSWPLAHWAGPAGTRRHRAALFACFVAFFTVGNATLMPRARAWRQERDVQALLDGEPLFTAVLQDEPELREPLRAVLLKAYRNGPAGEAVKRGQQLLAPRLLEYVPRAADAAAVRVGRALVASLEDLQERDPDQCYRFLYPGVAGPPRDADADEEDRLLAALREAVATARDGSAEPLDRKAAARQVDAVYQHLREEHGTDVDVLKKPQAPGVDHSRVCAVTIALYSKLAALPPTPAGQTLRLVLGPAAPKAPTDAATAAR